MSHDKHLEQLRFNYVLATPAQRLAVAMQRIQNPDHGANLVVIHVSAIEGFARSLAMHQEASTKDELLRIYEKYRNPGPETLITKYLQNKIGADPEGFFGAADWELFGYAVQYRNAIVHEATYLGQATYPELISACERILVRLTELAEQ